MNCRNEEALEVVFGCSPEVEGCLGRFVRNRLQPAAPLVAYDRLQRRRRPDVEPSRTDYLTV